MCGREVSEEPRAPDLAEFADVTRLATQLLRAEGSSSVHLDYPHIFAQENLAGIRVIGCDQRIVALTATDRFVLRSGDRRLMLGGIGSVATDARYQGRGFASRLVEDACLRLADQGVAIAVLWSDIPEFYERLGFRWAGTELFFQLHSDLWQARRSLQRFRIGPVTPDDIDQVDRLHRQLPVWHERCETLWKGFLSIPHSRFLGAWMDDQLFAYLAIGKGADMVNHVHEWAGDGEALRLLVESLFDRYHYETITVMGPPIGHPFFDLLGTLVRPTVRPFGLIKTIREDLTRGVEIELPLDVGWRPREFPLYVWGFNSV